MKDPEFVNKQWRHFFDVSGIYTRFMMERFYANGGFTPILAWMVEQNNTNLKKSGPRN
jgi:hypothetical protein